MIDPNLLSILLPSFCGSVLILVSHLILGRQILARGIVFMDLAIAQIAALGAVVAHLLSSMVPGFSPCLQEPLHKTLDIVMPFIFSIAGASMVSTLSHHTPKELEAIIGCIYVLAATGILLLLSNDPNGAEHMSTVLGGRVLWLQWSNLAALAAATLMLLITQAIYPQLLQGKLFYPVFAVLVTMSVNLSGVYLVFSTLIMPALAVSGLPGLQGWLVGYSLGVAGIAGGLVFSSLYDYPGGASIVLVMAIACASFRLLAKCPATASR